MELVTSVEPCGLTARQHEKLKQRCRNIYSGHQRRAKEANVKLDYTSVELIRWAEKACTGGTCPICDRPITIHSLSFDHKQPTSRGGQHTYANLTDMCRPCNQAKGNLAIEELSAMLAQVPQDQRRQVLARLRSGNRFYSRTA